MPDELSQIAHLFLSSVDSPAGRMTVRALLVDHLPDPAAASKRIASHFARQLGSSALLQLEKGSANLRLFGTGQASVKQRADKSGLCDVDDLSGAVSDLPNRTSMLLVALEAESDLLSKCPEISVVVCPESKTVVDGYSQLKRLAGSRALDLGLSVVDCLSVAQGQSLAERLCQAAKEFLGLVLRLDAVVLGNSRLHEKKLAETATVDEGMLARSIDSVLRA